ncbi:hypothetical protein C5615_18710 [Burkholderia cepacia]|uniref:Uncharacterized protein n=1 Tax=Burkholderia cepacia TaxID=292 RepID=A0A2S8IPK1_BURCE|nr:hypothetical protein [Burkholderia cepacia]PQP16615.1 hypothetical protein C5615_18710 [Burkholderia cepacia]HDR9508370.1 hypothetical protein [Burkholderia cepacia]
MKNKDEKQTSFDFDRPSKVTIGSQSISSKPTDSVIRVVFSNENKTARTKPKLDVYEINRRILDLVK